MSIVERTKVVEAYTRVLRELGGQHHDACAAVARALSLPAEVVEAVLAESDVEVSS